MLVAQPNLPSCRRLLELMLPSRVSQDMLTMMEVDLQVGEG